MKFTVGSIKGLQYEDILKMDEKELRKAVNAGSSAANKRIRRIKETEHTSGVLSLRAKKKLLPFDASAKELAFTSKGKDLYGLRGELSDLSKFLGSKSSTLTGIKSIEKNIDQKLPGYVDMTVGEKENFWDVYNRVVEAEPYLALKDSNQLMKDVKKVFDSTSSVEIGDIVSDVGEYLTNEYLAEEDDDYDYFTNSFYK